MVIFLFAQVATPGMGSGCPNHSEALTGHSASTRRIEPTCEVVRAARPPDSNFFELLAIARVPRAKPEMAIDRTKAAGEYCFKSSESTMVHYASQPESTGEDVVYEFDATQLLAAGLDPQRVPRLPALGKMEPGKWYFLPSGVIDPHHQHDFATPTIALAVNVK